MDTGNCGVFAFTFDQVIGPTRTVLDCDRVWIEFRSQARFGANRESFRVKRSRPRPLLKRRSMASMGSARVVASDNVGAKAVKRASDALNLSLGYYPTLID
jgi:hypothetical protein